jgi:hypothetical protein
VREPEFAGDRSLGLVGPRSESVDGGHGGDRDQPLLGPAGRHQQAVLAHPDEVARHRPAAVQVQPDDRAERTAQPVEHRDPADLLSDPVRHLAVQVAVPQRREL